MKLTKCVNGHFYDEEKYSSCPHCQGASGMDGWMDSYGAPGRGAGSRQASENEETHGIAMLPYHVSNMQQLFTSRSSGYFLHSRVNPMNCFM